MNHASLFSGIGGFDLAAREVGWNNVFQCEIDPFCQSVLKYYFSKTVLYEDIKRTDFTSWKGKIDVLTGGFPCQPFSVAGQRKGADDNRYLWPEMLRVIRETRPLWVIGENVAGITNMVQPGSETDVETKSDQDEENYKETILEQEYIINTICDDLEREGYSVTPTRYIGRYYISWPLTRTGITCIVISRYLQVIWEQLKWRGLTMIRITTFNDTKI